MPPSLTDKRTVSFGFQTDRLTHLQFSFLSLCLGYPECIGQTGTMFFSDSHQLWFVDNVPQMLLRQAVSFSFGFHLCVSQRIALVFTPPRKTDF